MPLPPLLEELHLEIEASLIPLVRVGSGDIHENVRWITQADLGNNQVSPEELAHFLLEVSRSYLDRSPSHEEAVFYSWIDHQAGQLRMNGLVGSSLTLPFSGRIIFYPSPSLLAAHWLESQDSGLIPWSELEDVSDGDSSEDHPTSEARVWARDLGSDQGDSE